MEDKVEDITYVKVNKEKKYDHESRNSGIRSRDENWIKLRHTEIIQYNYIKKSLKPKAGDMNIKIQEAFGTSNICDQRTFHDTL